MRRRDVVLGIVALAGLVACAKTDAPADPVWGKEPCAHCRMLVGDKRFAAQAVVRGDRKYFDDIGCMVLFTEKQPAERTWVRDAASSAWVDAKTARYVDGQKSPMDFGFEAQKDGKLGWDDVRASAIKAGKGQP